ncbi:MAG TPA: class I SAM-dependent methyltransferase [Acidobacteriaceae bacterium]|jgi:ubiquinone/menaquinone biosynthesis C-methylase UbiE|nr:class I SAM-dependent methyltransferase [Acidobacteriaceae bacterium]
MLPNPTDRFTGRVESYRRYRPTYPPAIVDLLTRACALNPESTVADVAAGTGLLTEIFLSAGFTVTAIEPNDEMRAACATLEPQYPKLQVRSGTAEAAGLPDHSVDLITVAQAMHWFDLDRARAEFARILKPGGCCAAIYNNRRLGGDPFHDGYELLLLDFGVDYGAVKQQHVGRKRLAQFFSPSPMQCASLPNSQALTLEALEGRILSSSYMPQPCQPRYDEMRAAIERLFAQTQSNGAVTMEHDCLVCYGQI